MRASFRTRRLSFLLFGCALFAHLACAQGVTFYLGQALGNLGDTGVVAADFDGDGIVDLASASCEASGVAIALGNGDGTFRGVAGFDVAAVYATELCGEFLPQGIVAGDLDGDNTIDLAVTIPSNEVSILLGNGDGTFGAHVDFLTSTGPEEIAIGDFNGDGLPDLVTANPPGGNISVLLGTGAGLFAPHADFPTGLKPTMVVVGDFDQDGNDDVGASALGSDAVSVLLGNGDGTFGPRTDFSTGDGPAALAQGDFNGDGIVDSVTGNLFADSNSILLGNGDGTFAPHIDLGTAAHPIPTQDWMSRYLQLAVEDFNADGNSDLLTADPVNVPDILVEAALALRLGNGDGTFGTNFQVLLTSSPGGIATGDFNADGKVDLVLTDGPNDSINILLQSPFFLHQRSLDFALQSPGTTSPPQSVTVQNTGSLPLTISSVALRTDIPTVVDQFSITGDACSSTPIPPGDSCSITVVFSPTTPGSKAATLLVQHETFRDAPNSMPPSVNLTGTGTDGVPPPSGGGGGVIPPSRGGGGAITFPTLLPLLLLLLRCRSKKEGAA